MQFNKKKLIEKFKGPISGIDIRYFQYNVWYNVLVYDMVQM